MIKFIQQLRHLYTGYQEQILKNLHMTYIQETLSTLLT
jgi:hypothetical protein